MRIFGKVTDQDCVVLADRLRAYGSEQGWDLFVIQSLPVVDLIGEVLGFSVVLADDRLTVAPAPVQAI